jgi:hypothetical protein
MNFKIIKFLLVLALFCSAVLAPMIISTDLYAVSCGGDPVGGGHPCGGDPVGGGHPCGGDPVGGGHP